ncbi:MAG: hypothetical protein AB8B97_07605 [Granulosicoccus sp.]
MNEVFTQLKNIMLPVAHSLDITTNKPGDFDVYTFHVMENKKCQWFGGIKVKKNYVSYHLMPVYENPGLVENISPELKKRMQGKSCFNFKVTDESLFCELSTLTTQAYEDYVSRGYITDSK